VEGGPEAEGGVASGDIRWINSEDGGGVSENGGLELASEVVVGGESERGMEGVVFADEPNGMMSMLDDFGSGSSSGRDEAEGEGGVAGGGTRAVDLGGALEQFN